MKAIAATPGVRDSLALITAADPQPGDRDVLVEVVGVGVCGTDSEIREGRYGKAPQASDYLIIGHEALGKVAEVGPLVRDVSVGDHVVASVRRPCPHEHCRPCRGGAQDFCTTGDFTERGIVSAHGFLAQYYVEDQDLLTLIPAGLEQVGVLLEPMSVVEKAVRYIFAVQERIQWEAETAVVLGAGAIGLLATVLLRLRDIETFVVDRSEAGGFKSQLISELGAGHVSTAAAPLSDAISEIGGVDVVMEATGFAPLVFEAAPLLKPNGIVAMLGISGDGGEAPVRTGRFNDSMVLGNRLMFGSVNAGIVDFRSGVEHLQQTQRRWPGVLDKLISRRVPFHEFQDAFDRRPDDIKAVIEVSP